MKEKLPRVMVLVFNDQLGHSVWQDCIHRCRTMSGLTRMLKDGIKEGRYVAFRLMTIHKEEMGIVP